MFLYTKGTTATEELKTEEEAMHRQSEKEGRRKDDLQMFICLLQCWNDSAASGIEMYKLKVFTHLRTNLCQQQLSN